MNIIEHLQCSPATNMKTITNQILILLALFFISGCSRGMDKTTKVAGYTIQEIKRQNSWYEIYATKDGKFFKIVSKSANDIPKGYEKLKQHRTYHLDLTDAWDYNSTITPPIGFTGCFYLDSTTNICLEPSKGILDLHVASNLKGIYIKKREFPRKKQGLKKLARFW